MEAAVVSSTQGAVRILLGKLGDVLATKCALLSGVREEIQELKDELESMTACLRDLADGGNDDGHNEQMRTWMKQVREVAYDVEDCIDAFCHHLGKHSGTSCLHRMIKLLRTMRVRHKLATEIKSLQSRAQKVSDRRHRYRLDVAAGATSNRSSNEPGSSDYLDLGLRLPALHGDGSRLVGMGGRTGELVELLEQRVAAQQGDAASLRVVSIVGFGGLGKTTLARTVYTSPAVHGVQCRAFVAVSQTYDLRSLLESVLKQTYREDSLQGIKDWDINKLVEKSRDYLKDKRYLIVLDDVWRPAAWEKLRIAFPDNDKQSRILITTRSQQVARNCCTSSKDIVYDMEPLTTEDSELLFFKTVFESDACPPQYSYLEQVSKDILKKCSGLPLAIVSIGGMLARRQNKTQTDWQRVCAKLGSELERNPTLEGMRRILTLSYNDMPYNLKACFLYLSAFPEDYEIRRGPLVRRWAAEGLIAGMHELSLEEIAQSYFDEFVSRSMVIPGQLASSGDVRSCKVHDIMLEVIASKSVQENFISFLGSCQYNTVGHDKIRRLSIHPGEVEKAFSSKNLSHARSLTILGSTERPVHITFTEMKLLRVLDLEGCPWLSDQDLKDICRLSLLRYLNLRSTPISQLPNVVGKLKELVTLDVRDTDVTEFPRTITQLQNLKHLLAGCYKYYTRTRSIKHVWSAVKLPPGLRNMCGLRRVPHVEISTSSRAMHEVGELSQLTRLCAINVSEDYSTWEPFVNSLNKLSNSLRYLSVVQEDRRVRELDFLEGLSSPPLFLQSLHLWARLSMMPQWVSSLSNLASVSLRETYLGAELVEALGTLPNLLSLKLYTNGYVGNELCFEQDRFPQLKQLIVDNLRDLDELSFRGGAPNLERLTLAFCHLPNRGISGIENLLKLREVEFFSDIIDSLVEGVIAVAKSHPNRPKVTRDVWGVTYGKRKVEDTEFDKVVLWYDLRVLKSSIPGKNYRSGLRWLDPATTST